MKGILKYIFKFSSGRLSQPLWRNGLAHWTSNSKVVGSSPTRGVVFFAFFSFFLTFCSVRIPPYYSWLRFLFFKIKKKERNHKTEPLLLKATSIPGFSLTRPFERGCSESCMTSTSKRDAIRLLHALKNLNQLKWIIVYSIPFIISLAFVLDRSTLSQSLLILSASARSKMNFTSIHASFLLFLIIYKNEKKFSCLYFYIAYQVLKLRFCIVKKNTIGATSMKIYVA